MKKGFGIFFIIIGGLNFLSGIMTPANSFNSERLGFNIIFGIGMLGLGIWMVNSAKKKDE